MFLKAWEALNEGTYTQLIPYGQKKMLTSYLIEGVTSQHPSNYAITK
jgi:hypothetical protein